MRLWREGRGRGNELGSGTDRVGAGRAFSGGAIGVVHRVSLLLFVSRCGTVYLGLDLRQHAECCHCHLGADRAKVERPMREARINCFAGYGIKQIVNRGLSGHRLFKSRPIRARRRLDIHADLGAALHGDELCDEQQDRLAGCRVARTSIDLPHHTVASGPGRFGVGFVPEGKVGSGRAIERIARGFWRDRVGGPVRATTGCGPLDAERDLVGMQVVQSELVEEPSRRSRAGR